MRIRKPLNITLGPLAHEKLDKLEKYFQDKRARIIERLILDKKIPNDGEDTKVLF